MDLNLLVNRINKYYNVDIRKNSRKREVVMIRAVYYFIAKEKTTYSLDKIGDCVNRHHASVIHSLQNFDDWIKYDEPFKLRFENLKNIIYQRFSVSEIKSVKLDFKLKMLKIAKELLLKELIILKKNNEGKN
mgnify:CR=1 FL=1|tara:strand:- start:4207 stop:4602 length:396 start_codon:yes stop_codon:yes gene_type:complete